MKNCVVVLNYNDYENTELFLSSISEYDSVDFIVVVDNNSTDNSFFKLKKFESSSVAVVSADKNGGYGYGNNFGFKYLREMFGLDFKVIFSNPDIEITEDSLKLIFNNIGESVGAVGPVVFEDGSLNRGIKNSTVFKSILSNIPMLSRVLFSKLYKYNDSVYDNAIVNVDLVSGSIFGISAKVFDSVGMFDENVFLYYEENILAYKLKQINNQSIIVTSASALHHHSVSVDKNISSYRKLVILKESQLYYHRTYEKSNKFLMLLLDLSIKLLLMIYKKKYGEKYE